MAQTYLVSTVVTGVLLLFVVGYVARSTDWRRRFVTSPAGETGGSRVHPAVLAVVVLAVVLLSSGVGAVLSGSVTSIGTFLGFFGGLLVVYLGWGIYHIAHARGLKFSQSVAVSLWAFGLLFILVVVGKLLVG